MNHMKSVKRQLGDGYSFQKHMTEKEIHALIRKRPSGFSEAVCSSLTVGCVKLELVIFKTAGALSLGYDLFVKDSPDSSEWICYDNLIDEVCTKDRRMEAEMFAVLDRAVSSGGLSYTECNFDIIGGKQSRKDNLPF